MVTPVLLFLAAWWAVDRRDPQATVLVNIRRVFPYWLFSFFVFIAYLALRWFLYDTPFGVHQRGISWLPMVWMTKIPVLGEILLPAWRTQPVLYAAFWTTMAALLGPVVYEAAVRKNYHKSFILAFLWVLLAVGGLLPHLHQASPVGQGIRLLYSGSAYFAILTAPALAALINSSGILRRSAGLAITAIALGILATAQHPAQRDWTYAVHYIPRLQQAIYAEADHIEKESWALVLVPEHIGVALVGRHGQGALVSSLFQPASLLDRMVPFVAPDLDAWRKKILDGIMYEIRGADDGMDHKPVFWPKYFYCADPVSAGLIALHIKPDDDPTTWRANWYSAVAGTPCAEYLNP